MKKLVSTADLGGAPFYKSDFRELFNEELWDVIEAMFSPFDSDTQGIVVSGCVTTANASNFDMTAGIVYLNGEFMRIAAVTNQAFTKYIAPSTTTSDSRIFQDASINDLVETKLAGLVSSIPGAGQYITIASLTDLDDRRFRPTLSDGATTLRTKVVEIGDWDMLNNVTTTVLHGLPDYTKIRSVSVLIRPDFGSSSAPIASGDMSTGEMDGCVGTINTTVITLQRNIGGGRFSTTLYDSTGYNRGWVTITYEA